MNLNPTLAPETKSVSATLCRRTRRMQQHRRESTQWVFRELRLSGERFEFPDAIRPQALQSWGRHSGSQKALDLWCWCTGV